MRLRAFIGSSSESLAVAKAIASFLNAEIDCVVWSESFFKFSNTTIESLTSELDKFDIGLFIYAKDDGVSSRGLDWEAPRDNVLFEHGLFCGRFGPKQTFVFRPKSKTLKWLSDLDGFTPAWYDDALAVTDPAKAVELSCRKVLEQLRSYVPRPGIFVNGHWEAIG